MHSSVIVQTLRSSGGLPHSDWLQTDSDVWAREQIKDLNTHTHAGFDTPIDTRKGANDKLTVC